MPRCVAVLGALAALSLLLAAAPVAALDPAKTIGQYVYEVWGPREGLPVASVFGVARTPDGYLWIGTESGLLRFDGVRFTLIDRRLFPELKADINELLVDRGGALWIGTDRGLVEWRDGAPRRYTTAEGLADDRILHLYADRDDAIWIGTRTGLSRFKSGHFTSYTARDGLPHDVVQYVTQAADGSMWIATNGGLAHLARGRFRHYTTKQGLASDLVQTVREDRNGVLWVGTFAGLHRIAGNRITIFTTRDGLSHDLVDDLVEDGDGSLWISTYGGGITRYRDGRFDRFSTANGLASNFLNGLFLDRDGSLWLSMDNGGLGRLRDGLLTPYTSSEGLASNSVRVVLEDRAGALWIGTHGGGLSRLQHGRFTTFTTKDGLPSDLVFSLAEDRRGRLWIGAYNGGLSRMEHGRFTTFASDAFPRNQFVRAIHEDRAGAMWLGTHGGGLRRIVDDTVTTFTTRDGLAGNFVTAVTEDSIGALWIGTGTGLTRYAQGRFTTFSTKDGLPDAAINALHADSDGSIWVASAYGLSRVKDGRVARIEPAGELFGDTIHRILADQRGSFWCSSNRGVYRVSRQELHEAADGARRTVTVTLYGIADGMKTAECNGSTQPAGWRARDGRLWFPTQQGVVVVDPARADEPPTPPRAIVEDVMVDGRPLATVRGRNANEGGGPASRVLVVAPGSRQVEFHYTSPHLSAPGRVRFRYRLDGYDDEWVEAGTRRVANYADLPPGAHRFRVATAIDGGAWTSADATLALWVEPRFYQTWWFVGACGVTLIALVGGAHRYRVNQLLAMERVRTHIASDLHDDIGSSLSQIAILSEVVRARIAPAAPEVAEPLERIGALSRESVDAMGDIVWAISPHRNTPAHLSQRMRRLASDLLPARGIRLTFESTDDGHARLGIEARREVFLIFKEALNNVVRHAAATEVSIVIAIARGGLRLVVGDNGSGFDASGSADGPGQGLHSMRRRATGLGGTLTIASAPDSGTRLELHLPKADC
jgi:ligand-binding sensor domain-containing protein/signal transduction histidine kinase